MTDNRTFDTITDVNLITAIITGAESINDVSTSQAVPVCETFYVRHKLAFNHYVVVMAVDKASYRLSFLDPLQAAHDLNHSATSSASNFDRLIFHPSLANV